MEQHRDSRIAIIEAGSPGLHIYTGVAMGRGAPLLATIVRNAGYDVRAFVEDISGKDSVDWEYVRDADVIGFSAITCTLTRTAKLVAEARKVNPQATIVFGGPEPTCAPQRSFDAGADFVIRGEAEHSLLAFLGALKGDYRPGEPPSEEMRAIPGIVWSEGGALRFGPPPGQLEASELSELPIVDMSVVHRAERRTTGLTWRSRGCPERCTFCEVHEIWPRYSLRDETTSVEELMQCQADGAGGTFLIDDNAVANKPSFKRFLREAIGRGYARPITVQLRADAVFNRDGRLDRELLRLLRDLSPMTMLAVGVESSEDSDLAEVGKQVSSDRMARALKAMRRYGLLVHGMFIAFTGDTIDTLRRNGRFAREYVTSLQYLFETPLPGTQRTAEHEAAGRVLFRNLPDLKFLDGMHVSIHPERLTPKAMQEAVTTEYQKFYSRWRIVRAFASGLFLRYRRLGEGQIAYLKTLRPLARIRQWAWLHLQFKFAPWMMLRIGRQRVLAFLRDPEYRDYLVRLEG